MEQVPFDREVIDGIIDTMKIDVPRAQIREMNNLVNAIEKKFDTQFIRMEFGVPGFPASPIGPEAEAKALLEDQVAHVYAPFMGIPELKEAGSRFVEAFLDLEVPARTIVPTNGAMHASFIAIAMAGAAREGHDTILFLDPGFPVNRLQTRFLGLKDINLDLKDFRGAALIEKVEELCAAHAIGGAVWSSPNNPSWVNLTEDELKGLAEVFKKHGVIAIEDMAYFGMDFRQDYSVPFQAPFQPTIARYMDQVFIIISTSKLFSYAGQRCALAVLPESFADASYPHLAKRFSKENVLLAFLQGGIYPTTASIAQSPQRGVAALLNAAVEGRYNPFEKAREYGRRAARMKKAFTDNGFYIVYDKDQDRELADGFYFTVAYPGMTGAALSAEIIYYGVSAITLDIAGSSHEGLRACSSLIRDEQFEVLAQRLKRFQEDHPV